jgi:hypothetical protein
MEDVVVPHGTTTLSGTSPARKNQRATAKLSITAGDDPNAQETRENQTNQSCIDIRREHSCASSSRQVMVGMAIREVAAAYTRFVIDRVIATCFIISMRS